MIINLKKNLPEKNKVATCSDSKTNQTKCDEDHMEDKIMEEGGFLVFDAEGRVD